MHTRVKICGLREVVHLNAAIEAGAAYVGFVFHPKSPRALSLEEARHLSLHVPEGVAKVGLVADATNMMLDALAEYVPLDMLQLHGAETPSRVTEVRTRYGLPVMKAVGLAGPADLERLPAYESVADQILVDAKAPEGALPGGNGLPFDWSMLAGRTWKKPWMLAGGLTAQNVGLAIRTANARQVDVSSGVESAPGIKDVTLIRAFLAAAIERA